MTAVGDTIGSYQLEREIGRGGMGVVYLSRDTRLNRPVAIKALPEDLADDADRLARFEREARTLAQLNHPNIAAIHAIEEAEGRKYLVLEYVEGETLADRLDRGPLLIDETLELCTQIAAGLEAAHEAGVVHRDLKPANVKIGPDGDVKVLDFGLAKAEFHGPVDAASPTVTTPVEHSPTIPGAIMGTPPYMSPEQARGRTVDKRSDIWSFGVVVYECLTGRSLFEGESATDCIGAILHKGIDLTHLPPGTPPAVQRILRRCLERDKKERLRDIGDARLELEHARRHLDEVAQPVAAVAGNRRGVIPWVLAVVATAAAAVAGFALVNADRGAPRRLVAEITPPEGLLVSYRSGPIALAPDGTRLAFVAVDKDRRQVLCVRDLESGETQQLDDGDWIHSIFWSPDGRSVGYISDSRLMVVELDGGKPEVLTEDSVGRNSMGAAWGEDGTILYGALDRSRLMRVDRMSIVAHAVLDPFPDRTTDWPVWPSLLPDGDHFLFTNQDDVSQYSGVYVGSLTSPQIKPLLLMETNGVYVEPPGAVLYWRGGSLYAQSFDLDRLEFDGDPERVATDVWWSTWPTHAAFSVSSTGRLAYLPAKSTEESRLVWLDRTTGEMEELGVEGSLWVPRLAHDGRRIAVDRTSDRTAGDIVVLDVERGTELRLTRDVINESSPVWSPDDKEIYFTRGPDIYKVSSNGTGEATPVLTSSASNVPCDFAADGRTLLFQETDPGGDAHLSLLDLRSGEARPWLHEPSVFGRFSPDGRWVVYVFSAGGASQIVLTSYPDAEKRYAVASGFDPIWRADGKEIAYMSKSTLMAVAIDLEAGPTPTIGTPEVISQTGSTRTGGAAAADLQKFLLVRVMHAEPGRAIRIVDNWMSGSYE